MTHNSPPPNLNTPWLEDGKSPINRVWWRWLTAILDEALGEATPADGESVTVGGSPFSWQAEEAGHLLVDGGTVTAITLERGGTVYTTPLTGGFIPVGAGDIVEVTYAVAPTLTYLP